jgi:hypothetical protein
VKHFFVLQFCITLFALTSCNQGEKPKPELNNNPVIESGSKGLTLESTWHIQFTGDFSKMPNVDVYDIGYQSEEEKERVKMLKEKQKYIICYFSAGSYEDNRPDSKDFPKEVIGKKMKGWDEYWIDIRSPKVVQIMQKRMKEAKEFGCSAIDVDNIDGYTNDSGFPLTENDQISYNVDLANFSHSLGMQIGLKNALKMANKMTPYYDFAINEQCQEYKECHYYDESFVKSKKPVFHIEYKEKNCKNYKGLNTQLKKLSLNEFVKSCK